LPDDSFIIEPAPKGTAAVVGLAAVLLKAEDPEAVMAVLTADHAIGNEALFRDLLAAAYSAAQQGHLVTLGVEPTRPASGYGYLEQGRELEQVAGFSLVQVESFREKPDPAVAEEYFHSGKYCWNSGMFVWRADRILDEIANLMPSLGAGLDAIAEQLGNSGAAAVIDRVWRELKNETIDYGIMEKAEDVVMLPAGDLGWNDVGSWDSLFQLMDADSQGNIVQAQTGLILDSQGSLVVQEEGANRLIALLGVEDLVVIDSGTALLVTTREHAQEVKQIVEALQRGEGLDQYL
jgi:mannose-1-phosphate guanylyltransferase